MHKAGLFLVNQVRPKGSRNQATLAAMELLNNEAEALTRKVIDMALEGDITALRLCLERLVPLAKERPMNDIPLPTIDSPQAAVTCAAQTINALTTDQLLPSQAVAIQRTIDRYLAAHEYGILADQVNTLTSRLDALHHTSTAS